MDEDTRARLRRLEDARIEHGQKIASLEADVENQGQLVRAMAPLVTEVATNRGVANSAVEKADGAHERIDGLEGRIDSRQKFNLSQGIVLAGLIVSLCMLILLIVQLSGGQ